QGATVVRPETKTDQITHTLDLEEGEEDQQPRAEAGNSDLIPTTKYIRNFNVFYEEVVPQYDDEDFIIVEAKEILDNIEVVEPKVVPPKTTEDQFTLSFDMPMAEREEVEEEPEGEHTVTFNLDDGIGDLKVNEYVEVRPVLEYNKQGETRYNLEEYMELESQLTGAKSLAETHEPKLVEDELVFEKKTLEVEASQAKEEPKSDPDPFNSSISELLKDRADERRRKLKNFNYKFHNNRNSIDEIEKQPAYKRQGVDLSEVPKEQKVS